MEYGVRSFIPANNPTEEAVKVVKEILNNANRIFSGSKDTFNVVVDRAYCEEKYDCLFSLNIESSISCGKNKTESDGMLFAGYYAHGNKITFHVNKEAAKRLFELYESIKHITELDGSNMKDEEIINGFWGETVD